MTEPELDDDDELRSVWVKAGWFVAVCETCALPVPFRDRAERDAYADDHGVFTGHYVARLNGEDDAL